MIRELGSDASQATCACGKPVSQDSKVCAAGQQCEAAEPAREMAAAVNLRELGS